MSTLPAEMVRFGSIYGSRVGERVSEKEDDDDGATYDDCNERILELLIRELCVHVYS
jgi:hypothetical protein